MTDILIGLVAFMVGMSAQAVLYDAISSLKQKKAAKPAHHGLYGDHHASHWFRQRELETDPYWRTMPLRTYIQEKQRQAREDIH